MINEEEAILLRHSVRQYLDKKIDAETIDKLNGFATTLQQESGIEYRLVTEDKGAFDCLTGRLMRFRNANNYFAVICKNEDLSFEKAGYYGEKLVIFCQMCGLNTCWVVGSFSHKKVKASLGLQEDESLICVISVGYGAFSGVPHKSKSMQAVSNADENSPPWLISGVQFALLAPTAINQQKFYIEADGQRVSLTSPKGRLAEIDKGIVKYHFEIGGKKENFVWAN
jgi:hypothetical protein